MHMAYVDAGKVRHERLVSMAIVVRACGVASLQLRRLDRGPGTGGSDSLCAANGERWIFECVGDGTAVQDYWLPKRGGFGTNRRTCNSDIGAWQIVWAATNLEGLMQISAIQNDDGDVAITIEKPVYDQPRRIIFREPDDGGWNWVQ